MNNQNNVKKKLAALNHGGALMLLVDFLKEAAYVPDTLDEIVAKKVAQVVSVLKVNYMNDIVPVAKEGVVQKDLEDEIAEIKNEQK